MNSVDHNCIFFDLAHIRILYNTINNYMNLPSENVSVPPPLPFHWESNSKQTFRSPTQCRSYKTWSKRWEFLHFFAWMRLYFFFILQQYPQVFLYLMLAFSLCFKTSVFLVYSWHLFCRFIQFYVFRRISSKTL